MIAIILQHYPDHREGIHPWTFSSINLRYHCVSESSDLFIIGLFLVENFNLLRRLFHADMSHCILTVENLSDFFESGAFGLNKDKVDPDSLKTVPKLDKQCALEQKLNSES